MFPVRQAATPAPQEVGANYSFISGSDITLSAVGAPSAPCRSKYSLSFHIPAAASGLVLIRLFRSFVQSGLAEYWEPVATTITRPVKITAGLPKRVCVDFHDQLSSGITAGYDLAYRAEIKLADGSGPITIHDGISTTSTHLEIDFSYSTRNIAQVVVTSAEVGASAVVWGSAVELVKLSVNSGVSAAVWAGSVSLSSSTTATGVGAQVLSDWTDPILIGAPTATAATSAELGLEWQPVSGTVLTIPGLPGGYPAHYGVLSFEIPVASTGASGGGADFKAERSIDGGAWADVPAAVDSWSGPIAAEDSAVLVWTIDQTSGIGDMISVRYRLSGKTTTAGYEVTVNANGPVPERTYKMDFTI